MQKRLLSFFLGAAIFSLLFASGAASALTIQNLEPTYAVGSKIEFNTPEEGYSFDVTFLAQNQNLTYTTIIENNEEDPIVITQIDLHAPNYNFLNYSFEGLTVNDVMQPGGLKAITIKIASNNNATQTIAEDFNLSIHYRKAPEEIIVIPNTGDDANPSSTINIPDTGANSISNTNAKNNNQGIFFAIVIVASIILLAILLSNKKIKNIHAIIAVASLSLSFLIIGGVVVAEKDEVYTITGKVRFTNIYSISINPGSGLYNGESGIQTIECREGDRVIISDPTYDTYSFAGWTTDPQTTFETDNDGNRILVANNHYELSANWDEIYYNLTVDPNGGTYNGQTGLQVIPIRDGATATLVTPEKEGMTFVNWTKTIGDTSEVITDMNIIVEEDVKLTANYEDIYFDIIINPNGGSYNGSTTSTTEHVKYGTELTISDPSYNTYTFAGWDIDPSATMSGNTITAYDNYTLTAKWEEIYYNLTINPNGGSYAGETDTQVLPYRAGSTVQISAPSKTGANFSNWTKTIGSTSETFTGTSINMTSDITLVANYEDIYFDIVINPNGGLYNGSATSTTEHVKYGTELTISDPSYDTYRFTGWNITPNTTMNGTTLAAYDNYTLTAQWEEIYYTLTINPNGGTYKDSTETQETLYRAGTTVDDITTPAKEGMSFTNWTKTIGDSSETFTGTTLTIDSDITLLANYEDLYFNISVNPNGGKFNNDTEVYSTRLKYGSTLDLSSIERDNYSLTHWTMNDSDSLPASTSSLQVYSDITLVANWELIAYYTITVNPNGGTYAGSTAPTATPNVRNYSTFNLEEPSYEGYALQYWEVTSGTVNTAVNGELTADSFIVVNDVVLTAHWGRTVARIERTQNIYGSIMAAEGVAEEDDIITLLIDTEETVTNSKKVTLDLNNHTVTGSLTNTTSGDITIINGEINNPSGAAVTNHGTLTIGVDDYNDDGTANILNDNVRLIGTTAGLLQTNDTYKFYYYDGYLEGDSGLIGGYDGSPSYRNTFDGMTVHFYPFVNHVEQDGRNYQHIELESSDRAVSKTSVHGDIYYYNLQDNINTSIETGYKAYIVRNFDASYKITSPANTNVAIDLAGYTINANDTITVNGVLTIEDSQTTIETIDAQNDMGSRVTFDAKNVTIPHLDDTTTKITYGGSISLSDTLINNGELIMQNSQIVNTARNADIIENNNKLTMRSASLNSSASRSAVTHIKANTVYDIDENSSMLSNPGYTMAVQNTESNIVWNVNGYIDSLNNSGTLTIENGVISGVCNTGTLTVNGGVINGGSFGCASTSSYGYTGIYDMGTVTVNGGNIFVRSPYAAYGIYSNGCESSCRVNMNGGSIYTEAVSNYSTGISSRLTVYMTGGTIEGKSATGSGYGFNMYGGSVTVTGGTVRGSTNGAFLYNTPMTIGINDNTISTESPVVIGGSIALYGDGSNPSVNFYDGVLHGKTKTYTDNLIKGLPEATTLHTESSDDYSENTWLIEAENYLSVNGVNYNSLNKAYKAITSSTGTITAIADAIDNGTTPTIASNKNITIDLNGYNISYTQTITNNGNLTITDNSENQNGSMNGLSTSDTTPLIKNTKNLTINAGTLTSEKVTIKSEGAKSTSSTNKQATVTINGGVVQSTEIALRGNNYTTQTMNGGTIKGGYYGIIGGTAYIDVGEGNDAITVNSLPLGDYYSATGAECSTTTLVSGKITVRSKRTANGIKGGVIMSGGEVDVTTTDVFDQDLATGIYTPGNAVTITGGKVRGGDYGIDGYNATVTLGSNDGTISITTPEIIGRQYAVGSSLYVNFYDGVLRGKHYKENNTFQVPEATTYHIVSTGSYAENCWLVDAPNYLSVNGDDYNSLSKAYNAIEGDSGVIEVTADAVDSANPPALPAGKSVTFNINGHTVSYSKSIGNNGELTIVDSEGSGQLTANFTNNNVLNINSGHIIGKITGSAGSVSNLNGGTLENTTAAASLSGSSSARATMNISGTQILLSDNQDNITGITANDYSDINITSGQIKITQTGSSNRDIYGVKGGNVMIDTGEGTTALEIRSTDYYGPSIYGISSKNVTLNSGNVIVESLPDASSSTRWTQGISGTGQVEINGGSLLVRARNTTTEGVYVRNGTYLKINGGKIEVESGSKNAYGVTAYGTTPLTITDGSISCTSTSGATTYGIRNLGTEETANTWITGGSVYGGTYGIYNAYANIVTIGAEDSEVSTSNPSIRGDNTSIYSGTTNFYSGVLKGVESASATSIVVRPNYTLNIGAETIGEGDAAKTYETISLVPLRDVAMIEETPYQSLSSAIGAATTGDTIVLIEDSYDTNSATIPENKELTIDLNGHKLATNGTIENSGSLTIIDDSEQKGSLVISTSPEAYIIQNNENATLTVDYLNITKASKGINNAGTLRVSHSSFKTSDIAINNTGNFEILNNTTVSSDNYAIQSNGGQSTITDSTIDYIYNAGGTLNITNSTITRSGNYTNNTLVVNNGIMTLSTVQVSQFKEESYMITNTGTMVIENSNISSITTDDRINYRYGISNSGNMTVRNTDVKIKGPGYQKKGITNTGTITIESGTVEVSEESSLTAISNSGDLTILGGTITAEGYGEAIYNSNNLTLGEAEDPSSPNYGLDTANVSTTDPYIYASNGTGIRNTSKLYFYDGKIIGSEASISKEPAGVEYLYEAIEHTDENGYHYRVLEWMRQQP